MLNWLLHRNEPRAEQVFAAKREGDEMVAGGRRWTKVHAIPRWEPEVGEALVCTFLGLKPRSGVNGSYYAAIVECAQKGRMSITGSMLVSLITNSTIKPGDDILIVYGGMMQSGASEYKYKSFALYEAV